MWYNTQNHERNKAWLEEEKLPRASRARAELLSGEHPKAGAGVAVRMYFRGLGWEDEEITDVLPDGRAKVLWGSGTITTILKRKVAPALNAAHVFHGMNSLGVPKIQKKDERTRIENSRRSPINADGAGATETCLSRRRRGG